MLPDKMEHCIVFMNSWDVSGVFWSFSKCNITITHLPPTPLLTEHCGLCHVPISNLQLFTKCTPLPNLHTTS